MVQDQKIWSPFTRQAEDRQPDRTVPAGARTRTRRILHVNKFRYRRGGAESYMLDLAASQRAEGHQVAIFAMEHPDNEPDPNDDLYPARMELNPPPETVGERVGTALGVLYRRDARVAMDRMLQRFQPDVVHLHNIYHQLSPSILRPIAKRSVPAVMTLHDYKLACPTYQFLDHGQICEACISRKFGNAVKRRCNQGSLTGSTLSAIELTAHTYLGAYGPIDRFLCPSRFLLQKMAQARVYPDRLRHLPNFCDVTGIDPAAGPGRGVLYAGRLSAEKGVDTLIDAAALLPAGIDVTIAGDGPERAELEQRAIRTGVADRVHFRGRVNRDEVHAAMRAAAVVVVPSRWYENQPMTILEAFGCARPVVATHLGGLPELVRDGITGRLVPHDDPAALARALAEVVAAESAVAPADSMGAAARAYTVERSSLRRHLQDLEAIYSELA
ncbi:glycosyltransferase family 4 protein [Skermania piniformis]